jgi:hypothetical protein
MGGQGSGNIRIYSEFPELYTGRWKNNAGISRKRAYLKRLISGSPPHCQSGVSGCNYIADERVLVLDHVVAVRRNYHSPLSELAKNLETEMTIRAREKDISNLQVLCANCHAIKTQEER